MSTLDWAEAALDYLKALNLHAEFSERGDAESVGPVLEQLRARLSAASAKTHIPSDAR